MSVVQFVFYLEPEICYTNHSVGTQVKLNLETLKPAYNSCFVFVAAQNSLLT